MMLADMGCELGCYCCDITCSYPVVTAARDAKFTTDQAFIFETVALCQSRVMSAMAPGIEWADMHSLAYRTILERFLDRGLLVGPIEALMAANVGSYFMPHGLGHLIGCDTHDVGGYPRGGRPRDTRRGFKSLRCMRKLEAGMVLTVEPGVYFVDCLLDELFADPDAKAFAVASELERFRGTGGVRLEDSVLVTPIGRPARNLTTCPRTVADVEKVLRGEITAKEQLARLV
mmetsp:Transcript_66688/g.150634  ORF Transcript_66688/g.150634 Transcript_66688/m.150634 type:complete len:231 (-) Transcript_66688:83-775(-)